MCGLNLPPAHHHQRISLRSFLGSPKTPAQGVCALMLPQLAAGLQQAKQEILATAQHFGSATRPTRESRMFCASIRNE